MSDIKVGAWLEGCFLQWQSKIGKRQTLDDFAEYIGVSRSALNKWMNGARIPGPDHIELLADKFGLEIYELLNLPKPDARLRKIINEWDTYSEEKRNELYTRAAASRPTPKTPDRVVAPTKRKQKA